MKKSLFAIFMIVGLAGAFDTAPSLKVGLVHSSLKATQSGYHINSANGSANGLELGFDANFYLGESSRWGWSVGVGTELLGVSWDNPGVIGWKEESGLANEEFYTSDFLWKLTPNAGVFFDVWRSASNDMRVKLFANIGLSLDMLFGAAYDGADLNYNTKSGEGVSVVNVNVAATVPLSVGARFHFAKKHGVEMVFKTHLNDMEFENDYIRGTTSYKQKTKIGQDFSIGLRYVFEWGQDW